TVTVNCAVAVLPCPSVADTSTIVDPTGKSAPGACEVATSTGPSTRSRADASHVTSVQGPVASRANGAGLESEGAVESVTVTSKEHEPTLPWASVAVQVTVVVPTGKGLPEAGTDVTASAPSTRSVAVASHVTIVEGPVASTVNGSGHVTEGAVASVTVTVNE